MVTGTNKAFPSPAVCQTDVNECATSNGGCGHHSQCTTVPGARNCTNYIVPRSLRSPDAALIDGADDDGSGGTDFRMVLRALSAGQVVRFNVSSRFVPLTAYAVSVGPADAPTRFPCAAVTYLGNATKGEVAYTDQPVYCTLLWPAIACACGSRRSSVAAAAAVRASVRTTRSVYRRRC